VGGEAPRSPGDESVGEGVGGEGDQAGGRGRGPVECGAVGGVDGLPRPAVSNRRIYLRINNIRNRREMHVWLKHIKYQQFMILLI